MILMNGMLRNTRALISYCAHKFGQGHFLRFCLLAHLLLMIMMMKDAAAAAKKIVKVG
jgi:hypothetical protein